MSRGRQKGPLVFWGDAIFPLFERRDSRLSEIREFRNMRRDFNDHYVNFGVDFWRLLMKSQLRYKYTESNNNFNFAFNLKQFVNTFLDPVMRLLRLQHFFRIRLICHWFCKLSEYEVVPRVLSQEVTVKDWARTVAITYGIELRVKSGDNVYPTIRYVISQDKTTSNNM